MKLINVEPKDNYVVRIFLDDDSIVDFDVKAELERIPCHKPLYDKSLFKTVRFNLNPASPKNQAATRAFYTRIL